MTEKPRGAVINSASRVSGGISSDDEATLVDGSTGGGEPRADASPMPLEQSVRIGRFTVLTKLGAGGMGVVYSAYDDELDRKIAIKLLRAEREPERDRMRREAQALARLSDPHVVQIYEVGEQHGAMYVAMEYISGATLREWLKSEVRPWRAVVEMFAQAGAGLMAAHAVGLVHRDFKPDNVMVGDDGRARVLDFGLARSIDAGGTEVTIPTPSAALELHEPSGSSNHVLSTSLTSVGTLLGTPPYMSPEQILGAPVTAQSDQFSFCVALYEALYRQRPFHGTSREALCRAILYGPLPDAPSGARVPGWLRRVVARGLAKQPEERWPSMAVLLAALERDPVRARRRAGAVVLAFGLTAAGASAASWGQASASCSDADSLLADVWNDDARAAIVTAFTGAELDYGEHTAGQVVARLDAYARAWADAHAEACVAHRDGLRSDSLWDHQVSCLSRRRVELASLVDVLESADEPVIRRAVTAARGLPGVERCADLDALTTEIPPPPDELRDEVERVRDQLSKVHALDKTGRYEQAKTLAIAAAARADELGYPRLRAEALYSKGGIEERVADYTTSGQTLRDAYFLAEEARDDELAADIATLLVFIGGYGTNDSAAGLLWARHARAKLARAGRPDDLRRATLLSHEGTLLNDLGRFDEAEAKFLEALPILEREGELRQLSVLGNLAIVQSRQRRFDESIANFRRLRELSTEQLGAGHPETVVSVMNLAHALTYKGHNDEARALLEDAIERAPAALGPDHVTTSNMWSALAKIQLDEGDAKGALRSSERAYAIAVAAVGPEHRRVATILTRLGTVRRALGELEEAARDFERARELLTKLYPDAHPMRASILHELAQLELERDDLAAARGYAEDAVKMLVAVEIDARTLAEARETLALALWGLGERERARELAAEAERALCADDPEDDACARIKAWRRERRSRG
ncbi:MAG: serine/threonine protein kinase [Myxococcales bacterium]|nr:serine/threonine protein kinase [Myxococcales bacterium]